MHGLLRARIPLVVRRLVTLVPALAILGLGVDPTLALVLSQVVCHSASRSPSSRSSR